MSTIVDVVLEDQGFYLYPGMYEGEDWTEAQVAHHYVEALKQIADNASLRMIAIDLNSVHRLVSSAREILDFGSSGLSHLCVMDQTTWEERKHRVQVASLPK